MPFRHTLGKAGRPGDACGSAQQPLDLIRNDFREHRDGCGSVGETRQPNPSQTAGAATHPASRERPAPLQRHQFQRENLSWCKPREGKRCHEGRSSLRSRSLGSSGRLRLGWLRGRPCLDHLSECRVYGCGRGRCSGHFSGIAAISERGVARGRLCPVAGRSLRASCPASEGADAHTHERSPGADADDRRAVVGVGKGRIADRLVAVR
jgi:hypothetical protein